MVSLAPINGVKSGVLYTSIGVGTVTMNDVAAAQVVERVRVMQAQRGRREFIGADFQCAIHALAQGQDARGIDVESDRVVAPAELDRERQPDVAQSDDADGGLVQ